MSDGLTERQREQLVVLAQSVTDSSWYEMTTRLRLYNTLVRIAFHHEMHRDQPDQRALATKMYELAKEGLGPKWEKSPQSPSDISADAVTNNDVSGGAK